MQNYKELNAGKLTSSSELSKIQVSIKGLQDQQFWILCFQCYDQWHQTKKFQSHQTIFFFCFLLSRKVQNNYRSLEHTKAWIQSCTFIIQMMVANSLQVCTVLLCFASFARSRLPNLTEPVCLSLLLQNSDLIKLSAHYILCSCYFLTVSL